jgi:hypothetical protein
MYTDHRGISKQSCFVFRGSQIETRPTTSTLFLSTSYGTLKRDISVSCHISSVIVIVVIIIIIIIIIPPFGTSTSLKETCDLFINLADENAAN